MDSWMWIRNFWINAINSRVQRHHRVRYLNDCQMTERAHDYDNEHSISFSWYKQATHVDAISSVRPPYVNVKTTLWFEFCMILFRFLSVYIRVYFHITILSLYHIYAQHMKSFWLINSTCSLLVCKIHCQLKVNPKVFPKIYSGADFFLSRTVVSLSHIHRVTSCREWYQHFRLHSHCGCFKSPFCLTRFFLLHPNFELNTHKIWLACIQISNWTTS